MGYPPVTIFSCLHNVILGQNTFFHTFIQFISLVAVLRIISTFLMFILDNITKQVKFKALKAFDNTERFKGLKSDEHVSQS